MAFLKELLHVTTDGRAGVDPGARLHLAESVAGGSIDTTSFGLVVFDPSWGRWGVGVSGTLPIGSAGPTTEDRETDGRSLSLGNSALVYDTEKSRWASLLASVNYGQVVSFAGQKWRPNFEAGYDFKDDPGNPKWVIRAGISLLLPK